MTDPQLNGKREYLPDINEARCATWLCSPAPGPASSAGGGVGILMAIPPCPTPEFFQEQTSFPLAQIYLSSKYASAALSRSQRQHFWKAPCGQRPRYDAALGGMRPGTIPACSSGRWGLWAGGLSSASTNTVPQISDRMNCHKCTCLQGFASEGKRLPLEVCATLGDRGPEPCLGPCDCSPCGSTAIRRAAIQILSILNIN